MSEPAQWQVVWEPDERIVGIVQYRDFLVVATERRVYRSITAISGDIKFQEVRF